MVKRTRKIDTAISGQMALIDTDIPEGAFDLSLGLKQTLSRMLQGHDRWDVATAVSRAINKTVSKESLDKILSSDPAYQPSALLVTVLTAYTGKFNAFRYLLEPLGSDVLDPSDRDLIELARIQEKIKMLESEKMLIIKKRGLEVKS